MQITTNHGDCLEIHTRLSNASRERHYWHHVLLNGVSISKHRAFDYAVKRLSRVEYALNKKEPQ